MISKISLSLYVYMYKEEGEEKEWKKLTLSLKKLIQFYVWVYTVFMHIT